MASTSESNRSRSRPNLPSPNLFIHNDKTEGYHPEDYERIGVPLYEASINCDWKAAEVILDKHPDLVWHSLTHNGETALHIAASVKRSKQVDKFVKILVDKMEKEHLELQNKNFSTALYFAASSGNIKTVRIMVEKNRTLTTIPGGADGTMMPLNAAALLGNYEVVKYLYENSNKLCDDDGWNPENRESLLEKCVEGDMFDIALDIERIHPGLNSGAMLRILARKPDAFFETETSIMKIRESINSVFSFTGLKVGAPKNESTALTLLRLIWQNILNHNLGYYSILRGPPDSLMEQDQEKVSGRAIQALEFQKLISEHVAKMKEETNKLITNTKQDYSKEQALQLQNLISESLVTLHHETQKIIKGPPELIKQDNIPVSGKGDPAFKLQNLIFEHIANMHNETYKLILRTHSYDHDGYFQCRDLKEIIFSQIGKIDSEIVTNPWLATERYSSGVLFIAAEMGNTNFLVEFIRQKPSLIWDLNDDKQSIFHIGVKYRREGIYNLLYEIGAMKDSIIPLKDAYDNNILHLAGKLATKERLADVSGAALQMQRELLWFKEVRNMVPPIYRERKNKDGLTPHELFTEEHKELVREGEKWMKETASQCMVVAALIATIVFAAAFTVPGGYNQDDGIPIFYRKAMFVVFVVADAMSLFLSSASLLTFLSILTSRYAEHDFVESLPRKLMLGLLTLFLSIATMVLTFSISFFILYHKEMKWIPILMSVVALMPVLLYVVLQYHVLADVIRSSYGSRYLFKPDKQVLYYVNTKPQVESGV
ncbi:putative ankyrin repeat-containing domain, PGG domain, ankyrin repeat-containing domain superfamily [Helianthus debilis subsp. tardiflorus]